MKKNKIGLPSLTKFVFTHKLLLLILILGVFLRLWRPLQLFMYSHDQDLLSWFVKDIVVNHNLRLIGQETSVSGMFIGPLFYYLAIPFYLLWGMNPVGGIAFATIIGATSILSIYFVFTRSFNKNVGYIASFLYAVCFTIVMTEREVVPTTPVFLWSIWFLYALSTILKGRQKEGYIVSAILLGLVWHLNLALLLLSPLLLIAQLFSRKRIVLKNLVWPVVFLALLVSPLVIFEFRNGFSQTNTILHQLSSESALVQTKAEKLDRVFQLLERNLASVWGTELIGLPRRPILLLLPAVFALLFVRKKISAKWTILLALWIALYVAFFTVNSLNLSEYYLNGTTVVFIALLALLLDSLPKGMLTRGIILGLLVFYLGINSRALFTQPINRSGFIERSAIVEEIKQDAIRNSYPCVAVSYITSPGFDLGYRYLFYVAGLHVEKPASEAPVYTIVFPHTLVDRIDKGIGALGLIYPDYKKYTKEGIQKSCSGGNSNLTDPLFGYVQ